LASDWLSRRHNSLWVCARPFSHADSSSSAISRVSPDVARHYSCFEDEPERPLPRYLADEFGWEPMTQKTVEVFHGLPLQVQADTAIFANDYGEAAAIDFFGPRYGLPASISKAEMYWFWGPRQYDGESVIVLGSNGRGDHELFRSVEPTGPCGGRVFSRRRTVHHLPL